MMPAVFVRTVPALASAGAVVAVGAIVIAGHDGPLARHMALHTLAMNVAAPILAALFVTRFRPEPGPAWLWSAALGQLAALWAAHVPAVHDAAASSHVLQFAMHGILLLAAFAFWIAAVAQPNARTWHAVAALLASGKLVCFLAVLLVFAPRALYGNMHHNMHQHHNMHHMGLALADQQLAGLLMIAACPLSYLLAAIIMTVQFINGRFAAPRTAR
jgi:putative membrane protein